MGYQCHIYDWGNMEKVILHLYWIRHVHQRLDWKHYLAALNQIIMLHKYCEMPLGQKEYLCNPISELFQMVDLIGYIWIQQMSIWLLEKYQNLTFK